tara:strand:- start:309 stop:1934 length:1626 start_codon:yes stop_codon:yes gene_type:complete
MLNNKKELIESTIYRDQILETSDKVELVSRIWSPEAGGPWPALLMRQPYGREIASTITYPHPSWWARNGYLVIVQDVRGQGNSGGEFQGFKQEASDTSATHKWVRSLKECNGRLGTFGFSYQGFTQLIASPETPPPDCLAPAMTGLNERDHWCCDGNAFWWHIGLAWGLQLACLQAKKNQDWEAWEKIKFSLENKSYLREGEKLLKEFDPEGMAYNWLKNSNKENPKWLIHTPIKSWLKQPMLLIGGWWDPHLKGIIDICNKSMAAGGNPELHIGPATHLEWWDEVEKLHLNFFNRYLKDNCQKEAYIPKKNLWNITTNIWAKDQRINSIQSQKISSWSLITDGSACFNSFEGKLDQNNEGYGYIELVNDPWRPIPSIGGHLSPKAGIVERSEIDKRLDVATFTSKPLKEDLLLEGIPSLEVAVKSDQEGFDLCVCFSIIKEGDREVNQISTGFFRVIGKETQRWQARKILLQPILATIKPKERIRISISGSSWPAIGINPGNGQFFCGPPSPNCSIITIKMNFTQSKFKILPIFENRDFH